MSKDLKRKQHIFRTFLYDPLVLLGTILFTYWLLDSWYKIFIQMAPTRMLWYSSMGLLITSIGLWKKNVFLLSSMFCTLLFQEGIWNLSFFANLISLPDPFQAASYAFGSKFPKMGLFITLFHLLLLPSIFYGLYKLKRVSRWGWLGAYIFALLINYLPLFFPDKEDVNCVRGQIASCQLFFGAFYGVNPLYGIFGGVTYQLFLIFIPANILLINISTKSKKIFYFLNHPLKQISSNLLNPDFYLSSLILLLTIFWMADTFEKVSIQHAVSRVMWWSSIGLLVIIIGLYRRSSLILTAMFCNLFVIETLWTIGFFTYLFSNYSIPHLGFAVSVFDQQHSWISFAISLFHLFLVPAILFGLLLIKKIHPFGWLLALIFHCITISIPYFIPDSSENINCSLVINYICQNLYGLSDSRPFYLNLIFSSFYQLIIFYLPLNFLLFYLMKKFPFRVANS